VKRAKCFAQQPGEFRPVVAEILDGACQKTAFFRPAEEWRQGKPQVGRQREITGLGLPVDASFAFRLRQPQEIETFFRFETHDPVAQALLELHGFRRAAKLEKPRFLLEERENVCEKAV